MPVRGIGTADALVALALATTGCTKSAPAITDDQVAEWRTLAAETIPQATHIEIRADRVTTMAGGSNVVYIAVSFASFADLQASYQAVKTLDATVNEQAPRAGVTTTVVDDGSDAFEAQVANQVLASAPGLEGVRAGFHTQYSPGPASPELSLTVYLYVTDPAVVNPTWLDGVADVAQRIASAAGGRLYSVAVLPSDAIDVDIYSSATDQLLVPVADLSAFKSLVSGTGCVRTDAWAYDLTNPRAMVYPASDPGGTCNWQVHGGRMR